MSSLRARGKRKRVAADNEEALPANQYLLRITGARAITSQTDGTTKRKIFEEGSSKDLYFRFRYQVDKFYKMGCTFSRNHVRVSRILKGKKVSASAMQIMGFQQDEIKNRACFAVHKKLSDNFTEAFYFYANESNIDLIIIMFFIFRFPGSANT